MQGLHANHSFNIWGQRPAVWQPFVTSQNLSLITALFPEKSKKQKKEICNVSYLGLTNRLETRVKSLVLVSGLVTPPTALQGEKIVLINSTANFYLPPLQLLQLIAFRVQLPLLPPPAVVRSPYWG